MHATATPPGSGPTSLHALEAASPGCASTALALLEAGTWARSRTSSPALVNELSVRPDDADPGPGRLPPRRQPARSATASPCCWSTAHRSCTWSSAPAPTRPCRCRVFGPAASWSRSVPPTCASPPTRPDSYLNRVHGLGSGHRRRGRVGVADRGVGSRTAARRPVAARPRRPDGVHRIVRRRRPVRRGLPGRRGARPATTLTYVGSCWTPPSWTACAARCATRSPARSTACRALRCWRLLERRNLLLVPLGRPPPLVPLPPPVRRRPASHGCWPNAPTTSRRCTAAPAAGTTQAGDMEAAVRHAFAAGDVDRAADLIEVATPELRRQRAEGVLRSWVPMVPPEVLARRPVLASNFVGALMASNVFDGVSEQARRPRGAAWRPPESLVIRDQAEWQRLPARGRDAPGRRSRWSAGTWPRPSPTPRTRWPGRRRVTS